MTMAEVLAGAFLIASVLLIAAELFDKYVGGGDNGKAD